MERPSEYLDFLRQRLPLEPMIREEVDLMKLGARLRGRCPEHFDQSRSLHVREDLYFCFACGRGGDVIRWTMSRHGLDEPSAIAHLAQRAGLPPV